MSIAMSGTIAAVRGITFATFVCCGTTAIAGGFYTPYQSSTALGTALAGASARSDDASFFFFNPATIAGLDKPTVALDVRAFLPSARISASQGVSPLGADLTGAGASGEMTAPVLAPALYLALPLTRDLTLGVGFSSPFAVVLNTQADWAGRFHLLTTDMRTYNYSSAFTYRVNSYIAVSAGLQIQRFQAVFEKSELIPSFFGFADARGFLKGEGTAVGAIAGVLFTPFDGTRIGISYRSKLTHHLHGTAGAYMAGVPAEFGKFRRGNARERVHRDRTAHYGKSPLVCGGRVGALEPI